jgi:Skp family chaperone for outer membrane proteins
VLEVTKSQLLAAALACLAVVSLAATPAAAQAQTAPRGNVALLDVNYIFKNHTRFKAMMADMKAEAERVEQQLKAQRDQIQGQQELLKGLKPGSSDYKTREQDIARQLADLNIQAQVQQKEFVLKQARIYHETYQEIQQIVAYYAAQQGYVAVIKFNGDAVDQENPDDVLRFINQDVVWFNQTLDITPVILKTMNERAGAATTATRPAVPFQR